MECSRAVSCDLLRAQPSIRSSFPFPAHSFLRVFDHDAPIQQLGADLVGALEVPRFTCLVSLSDKPIDLGFADASLVYRWFQYIEDGIEPGEQGFGARQIAGLE